MTRIKTLSPTQKAQSPEMRQSDTWFNRATEKVFTDLTRLAAHICSTPFALIRLADQDQCWIYDREKLLSPTLISSLKCDRADESSFCTLLNDIPFQVTSAASPVVVVRDLTQDQRFADHPFVIKYPQIRWCATVSLTNATGRMLGTLAVMDKFPRDLDPTKVEALQLLAGQVIRELESESLAIETDSFDSSYDLIQTVRLADQQLIAVNPTWRDTLGYTETEISQLSWWDVVSPESRDRLPQILDTLNQGQSLENAELIFLSKNGDSVWVTGKIFGLDTNNQVDFCRGIFRNITLEKQLETKYQRIFENAVLGLFEASLDGRYTQVNPSLAKIYGYESPEEFIINVAEIHKLYVDPNYWQNCLQRLEIEEEVKNLEVEVYRQNGTLTWISETLRLIRDAQGKPKKIEGCVQDLTTRKQAQATLQLARDQLKAVLDAVPGSVSLISSNFRYLGVNRHLAATYNLPPEAFVGKEVGFRQHVFADFVQEFFASSLEEMSREIETQVNGESRIDLVMGKKWLENEAAVFVGIDISDRKLAEARLQMAKDQLQAVLDAVPGTVSLISSNFRYIGVNRHLAATYNLQPEAFIGRKVGFYESAFAVFVREFFANPYEEASTEIDTEVNGSPRSDMVIAKKWLDDEAAVFVGIDITERKRAEAALQAELADAAEYVRSLLPPPLSGSVSIDTRYLPSTQLGGDCFDYYWLDDDHLVIYLLDVSGHGSKAALLSVSLFNLLRSRFLPQTNFYEPCEVLDALNQAIQMDDKRNMYFTIWYGVYHQGQRKLVYASAGHPPAVLVSSTSLLDREIQRLKTPCLPIGLVPKAKFVNAECEIAEGNILYIYSDGIYEISQPDDKLWGLDSFIEFLGNYRQSDTFNLDEILQAVRHLNGQAAFADDVSLMQVNFN